MAGRGIPGMALRMCCGNRRMPLRHPLIPVLIATLI